MQREKKLLIYLYIKLSAKVATIGKQGEKSNLTLAHNQYYFDNKKASPIGIQNTKIQIPYYIVIAANFKR